MPTQKDCYNLISNDRSASAKYKHSNVRRVRDFACFLPDCAFARLKLTKKQVDNTVSVNYVRRIISSAAPSLNEQTPTDEHFCLHTETTPYREVAIQFNNHLKRGSDWEPAAGRSIQSSNSVQSARNCWQSRFRATHILIC